MAYAKDGYPTELANKVGHVKLIQDPMIQEMIKAFEDSRPPIEGDFPQPTGKIELEGVCPIEQVITVDGSHKPVPNISRPERQVGFIQVVAQLIKMEILDFLRIHRMADPRKVRQMLGQFTHHTFTALPLAGVHIPGMSVKKSMRDVIHRFLNHYQLYDALSYLVYRKWQEQLNELPSMECLCCQKIIELPRDALNFRCSDCGEEHWLSDYLGLCDRDSEDRPRVEVISNFRTVLELLVLFSFIIKFRNSRKIMERTLFLLDGPLILRAQLSRLVEPIRSLIVNQRYNGIPLYLVGVEKTGEMRDFADAFSISLKNPGEYFIPDTKYIVEEIHGHSFNEEFYRNRVNYGAKAIFRAGRDHVLVLNIPTGDYILKPMFEDLIGFTAIGHCLSKLICYSYENALIPIILANADASISNQPSGGILAQFVDRILQGNGI